MTEIEIENYVEDDSFDDFYKRNKRRVLNTLKGKKMKKRHLRNAKKLLEESTDLPAEVKDDIIVGALDDTVKEAEMEGFEGDEFDNFRFANNVKKRAEKITKKPLVKKPLAKLAPKPLKPVMKSNAIVRDKKKPFWKKPLIPKKASPVTVIKNGQLLSPVVPKPLTSPSPTPEPVNKSPEEQMENQIKKATVVQSNGKLAAPSLNAGNNSGSEETSPEENNPSASSTSTATQGSAQNEQEKTTATPKEGEQTTKEAEQAKTKEDSKTDKPKFNTKWILAGVGIVVVIVVVILLLKGSKAASA